MPLPSGAPGLGGDPPLQEQPPPPALTPWMLASLLPRLALPQPARLPLSPRGPPGARGPVSQMGRLRRVEARLYQLRKSGLVPGARASLAVLAGVEQWGASSAVPASLRGREGAPHCPGPLLQRTCRVAASLEGCRLEGCKVCAQAGPPGFHGWAVLLQSALCCLWPSAPRRVDAQGPPAHCGGDARRASR